MKQNDKRERKKTPRVSIVVAVLAILLSMGEMGLIFLLTLVPLAVMIVAMVLVLKKRKGKTHSHDRVDHRGDLKINPKTGKVEKAPFRSAAAHSPREHWKQQLDDLLANGTIDRAEYRAMLNREFPSTEQERKWN